MDFAHILLRLAPALTMIVFGLHQFLKPMDWTHYIPGWMERMSPMRPQTSMRLHALGNMALGILLASGWHPLLGAWLALIWWASILPFAFRVGWTIGMRDLTITLNLAALVMYLSR